MAMIYFIVLMVTSIGHNSSHEKGLRNSTPGRLHGVSKYLGVFGYLVLGRVWSALGTDRGQ